MIGSEQVPGELPGLSHAVGRRRSMGQTGREGELCSPAQSQSIAERAMAARFW